MVKFKIDFPFSMLNKNELILNNSVTPEVTPTLNGEIYEINKSKKE